jgi:hypothetical protein
VSHDGVSGREAADHRVMIGFTIAILVIAGVLVALAGLVGGEMREDARKRDEVADLFMGPRASRT